MFFIHNLWGSYIKSLLQVEELVNGTGIFVKRESKSNILDSSSSETSAARMFLAAVFNPEALRDCSLMGKDAKGPLGKPEQKRKGLYRPGLSAVLSKCFHVSQDLSFFIMFIFLFGILYFVEAAKALAKENRWDYCCPTYVKKQLGTYQSEQRRLHKLNANQ